MTRDDRLGSRLARQQYFVSGVRFGLCSSMIKAAIALYEATGVADYLDAGRAVADRHSNATISTARNGGYFFTAADADGLIIASEIDHR